MDSETFTSFAAELLKLAAEKVDSPEELKKRLSPGDILYTRPRKIDGLGMKLFYAIEKVFQGSPYTHVGLYVGDGKVVDAGSWKRGKIKDPTRVHRVGLKDFTDRYDFKVLRVRAPEKAKEEAVQFAKSQVGKDFNMKGVVRLAIPWRGSAEEKDRARKELANTFFCSELVANAYAPHTNIAKSRKLKHVMPGDIFRSPLTRTVVEFEKSAWRPMMRAQGSKRVMKASRQAKSMKPQKFQRTFEASK